MTTQPDDSVLKYHQDVLSLHANQLFDSLIYEHHISSQNLKYITMEDAGGVELNYKGYFATKDRQRYWIPEEIYPQLPIRIKKSKELKSKDDIVLYPESKATFRITPLNSMTVRELIDDFIPFSHTLPKQWLLYKFVLFASYIGKTYICLASEPSFGKTSGYRVMHMITDKSPVFKPRSVPGCLNKITGTGVMVFDEAHESKKEIRDVMEEITLVLADGGVQYLNGALKAANTKNKYECPLQSITYLYNNVECYKTPDKSYFEVIFKNNKALNDRMLKLKLHGTLNQRFTREFDIKSVADRNKMHYINLAKELVWLQEHKQSGQYERRWSDNSILKLSNRKKLVWDDITWMIDNYCSSQKEYDEYIELLQQSVIDYRDMVNSYGLLNTVVGTIEEEKVE